MKNVQNMENLEKNWKPDIDFSKRQEDFYNYRSVQKKQFDRH